MVTMTTSEERRKTPDEVAARENYRKAIVALNLKRPQLALELMSKVLRVQPESTHALALMAAAALRNKDYLQAENAIREALRLDPQSSRHHLLYGIILLAKSQPLQAQTELEKARELEPLNPWPYYFLGASYLSFRPQPLADKARPYVYKAVELDPEEARPQALLTYQASIDGNLALVQQAYLRALAFEPQNAAILSDYGDFLLNYQARPQEALHLLKEAIRLDPQEKATQQRLLQAIRAAHPLAYSQLSHFSSALATISEKGIWLWSLAPYLRHWQAAPLLSKADRRTLYYREKFSVIKYSCCYDVSRLLIISPYALFLIYRTVMPPLLLFLIKRGWIK
jgi:Tfp pilus assembly protein PilF